MVIGVLLRDFRVLARLSGVLYCFSSRLEQLMALLARIKSTSSRSRVQSMARQGIPLDSPMWSGDLNRPSIGIRWAVSRGSGCDYYWQGGKQTCKHACMHEVQARLFHRPVPFGGRLVRMVGVGIDTSYLCERVAAADDKCLSVELVLKEYHMDLECKCKGTTLVGFQGVLVPAC